jgi:hypothetical protein
MPGLWGYGRSLNPVGYWLLAIGYWLLAIGYWLLAIGGPRPPTLIDASGFFPQEVQQIALLLLAELGW